MNNQFYTMYPYMNSVPFRQFSYAPVNAGRGGLLSSLFSGKTAVASAKTFSFSNLLNGASKTLGVINQAIPVVYQVKPIWNNAKTMFRVARELNKKSDDTKSDVSDKSVSLSNDSSGNSPQFFV